MAATPHGRTILVVDDEELVLKVVSLMLARAGYEVLLAAGGRRALEVCRQRAGPIHLALVDLMMPEMDGVEVMERLGGICPNLRVLFMSGYNAGYFGDAVAPSRLIRKPFTSAILLGRIEDELDAARTLTA
jgi:CheY-like chemotaxis protein